MSGTGGLRQGPISQEVLVTVVPSNRIPVITAVTNPPMRPPVMEYAHPTTESTLPAIKTI